MLAFPGYRYWRVPKALQRDGRGVNHKRVLRVMRRESLRCQLKRLPPLPQLLRETVVGRPDQAWVADLTSIRLPAAFDSLACLLDARHPYRVLPTTVTVTLYGDPVYP